MKLLCITDLHGARTVLDKILAQESPADVILLGGDLTNFGTPDEAERIVLRSLQVTPQVYAVAGNCDSPAIDERLKLLDVTVFECGRVWNDVGFYGVSGMPPWRGDMYEFTEQQIEQALEAGLKHTQGAARRVVLSHPPPRDTLVDRTSRGAHVGSTAVRKHVDDTQPTLVVCGHIHEARGITKVGATTIVNCGFALKGLYAAAELGEDLQVDLRHV